MNQIDGLLQAIKNTPNENPISKFRTEDAEGLSFDFKFDRYLLPKTLNDNNEIAGIATLCNKNEVISYAVLLKENSGWKLSLSNNDVKAIHGDLSRTQIANVLYSLTDKEPEDIHIKVYSPETPLAQFTEMDNEWYDIYMNNGVAYKDLFQSDEEKAVADKCKDCGGGGKKCSTYSWKCNH